MHEVEALAARLAASMQARLHVVVVGTRATSGPDAQSEALFGNAVGDLQTAAKAIEARFQRLGVDATLHLKRGQVAEAIRDVERELAPDVLLFGSSNRHALGFPGYGGVLDQVKNEVESSILVVRTKDLDGIAVGLDGSRPSLEAANVASAWATTLRVPVTFLLGQGAARPSHLKGSTVQVDGDPGKFFLDWARDHPQTLIVVGSRGTGNPGLLRMGSLSDRVSWGATASVLVVRPPAQRGSTP